MLIRNFAKIFVIGKIKQSVSLKKGFLFCLLYSLNRVMAILNAIQGSHRLEKFLNLEGFLEKSLKIQSALKSTGKSLKSLEKSLNSTIFCRT